MTDSKDLEKNCDDLEISVESQDVIDPSFRTGASSIKTGTSSGTIDLLTLRPGASDEQTVRERGVKIYCSTVFDDRGRCFQIHQLRDR